MILGFVVESPSKPFGPYASWWPCESRPVTPNLVTSRSKGKPQTLLTNPHRAKTQFSVAVFGQALDENAEQENLANN